MILDPFTSAGILARKPRASGDDPEFSYANVQRFLSKPRASGDDPEEQIQVRSRRG